MSGPSFIERITNSTADVIAINIAEIGPGVKLIRWQCQGPVRAARDRACAFIAFLVFCCATPWD
jgi:hypothetical protein